MAKRCPHPNWKFVPHANLATGLLLTAFVGMFGLFASAHAEETSSGVEISTVLRLLAIGSVVTFHSTYWAIMGGVLMVGITAGLMFESGKMQPAATEALEASEN